MTDVAGITTATGPRMLIDYARFASREDLRALLIDARQRRLLSLDKLSGRLASIGPVRGRGTLRHLVWQLDESRCDSVLEHETRLRIAGAGLPPPDPHPVPVQVQGRTLHVDIAWPALRVGIEVDGFAHHSSRTQLDRDHKRANLLALAKWTVLHVGWDRLGREREAFLTELRLLLATRLEDRGQMRP